MFPTKLLSLSFPIPVAALAAAGLVAYLSFTSMRTTVQDQAKEIATLTAGRDQAIQAAEECSRGVALIQVRQQELQDKMADLESKARKTVRKEQDNASVISSVKPEFGTASPADDYRSSVALINAALKRIQEFKQETKK